MDELGIGTDLDCRPAVNVIQKLIFVKPSLQVTFGVYDIFEPTSDGKAKKSDKSLTTLTVTNKGPGSAIISQCVVRSSSRRRSPPVAVGHSAVGLHLK
jgi:hypothetical protein